MWEKIKCIAAAAAIVMAVPVVIAGLAWGAILWYWIFLQPAPVTIFDAWPEPVDVEDGGHLTACYTYRKTKSYPSSNKDTIEIADHAIPVASAPIAGIGKEIVKGDEPRVICFQVDLAPLPKDIPAGPAEYRRELTYDCNPIRKCVIVAIVKFNIIPAKER